MMKGFKQKLIKKTGSSSTTAATSGNSVDSSNKNGKQSTSASISSTTSKNKKGAVPLSLNNQQGKNETSKNQRKETNDFKNETRLEQNKKIPTPSTPKVQSASTEKNLEKQLQSSPADIEMSIKDETPVQQRQNGHSASIDIPSMNNSLHNFNADTNINSVVPGGVNISATNMSHSTHHSILSADISSGTSASTPPPLGLHSSTSSPTTAAYAQQHPNINASFPQSSYPPIGMILDANMKSPGRNLTMSSVKSNNSNIVVEQETVKLPTFEDVIRGIYKTKKKHRVHLNSDGIVDEGYGEQHMEESDDDILQSDMVMDPIRNKNIDSMIEKKPVVIKLFIDKLEQCKILYDFTNPISDLNGKEVKTNTLQELIEFVVSYRMTYPEDIYYHVVDMFKVNLFRSIPPSPNPQGEVFDPDEDEPINELAWPHMSLVYEFFLRFIEGPDFTHTSAKPYVNQTFILKLLQLFDSEDVRERDSLKTTLHRIYGKFLSLRAFIRKNMANILLQMIYETEKFNGVAELLEILGSIINGFALPLKDEHKIFLIRVLIPLHKVRCLSLYHPQLAYCIVQFLEKEPLMTEEVVMGLLRYWPKINSTKEIMFLNEIEDIFEIMENSEFTKIQIPLCVQLTKCIQSSHFQIAERVLTFWNNEYFLNVIIENCDVVLPVLFPALYELTCQLELDSSKNSHTDAADDSMDIDEEGGSLSIKNSEYDKRIQTMENINSLLIKDEDPFILVEQAIHSGSWNKAIHAMAFKALKIFLETNYQIYEQCQRMYLEHCKKNFMILKKEEEDEAKHQIGARPYTRKNKVLNGIQASIELRNKMRHENWDRLNDIIKRRELDSQQ
ncbi:hypothetical protein QEN19_000582 [Hanseniaspora menglaensis]